jgi:hypothetical protein
MSQLLLLMLPLIYNCFQKLCHYVKTEAAVCPSLPEATLGRAYLSGLQV